MDEGTNPVLAGAPAALTIDERPELLRDMVRAARAQSAIYRPGSYWDVHTRVAVRQIERHGLANFRGETSSIGTAYADAPFTDVRAELDTTRGRPLKFVLDRVFPFSFIMDSQVALTRTYARDAIALVAARTMENAAVKELLAKYEIPYSVLGDCAATARLGEGLVSLHYVHTLDWIDRVSRHVPLHEVRSVFEIGGGFGANVHLLIESFPRVRKVVYLDIPPNLYVGTCYLRTLYGGAVRDFSETKALRRIEFRDDDSLEIYAVCPWQIESLALHVDLFWNANSFVEMSRASLANYAARILALPGARSTNIVLLTYGGAGPTTIPRKELPLAFSGRDFVTDDFWMPGWPNEACVDPENDANRHLYLFVSGALPSFGA